MADTVSMDERKMQQRSLRTTVARNLATTTKTVPQMAKIMPRWLLKFLPWVNVEAGTYRVNRRKMVILNDNRISVTMNGAGGLIEAADLQELSFLRGLDIGVLAALAGRFVTKTYQPGEMVVEAGTPCNTFYALLLVKW